MLSTSDIPEAPYSSIEVAESLDNQDVLRKYRDEFVIPLRRYVSGENAISGKMNI